MSTKKAILTLLAECEKDPIGKTLAGLALDKFRARGMKIATSGLTKSEKLDQLRTSRALLRQDLEEIVRPPDLADLDNATPPARYNDPINQTPNQE